MAANLDRAESALTAVSDIAYVRAIDSSGNSVRISKADLASVLGVKFLFGTIPQNRFIPADGDCLNINDGGFWQIIGGTSVDNGPAHSPKKNEYFYVLAFGTPQVTILLAVQTRGTLYYIGVKRDGDISWKEIKVTT